ncbi:hypothetical protein CLU79DRAFT_744952 [Phycomyces nitens]|nr:hypothetical protein CLU79DRAFT_744952 [Phycomyces nitens]
MDGRQWCQNGLIDDCRLVLHGGWISVDGYVSNTLTNEKGRADVRDGSKGNVRWNRWTTGRVNFEAVWYLLGTNRRVRERERKRERQSKWMYL